ncbi:MAG: MiaB/RimO family radical SAM methylthiotransferase [Anaerolineales bacterium]|nr:MiaB/RimO family radical SAM methylthiotransferase [Anaerolineales bacterium]
MKIYLDMIGCRLNQSEIEIMARQFTAAGHKLVADPGEADLAVVNTCTVTAAAAADSRKTIRRLSRSGVERIITTGCWSSMHPDQARNLPGITGIVSNAEKDTLVANLLGLEQELFDQEPLERAIIPGRRLRTRAFIKAQDGCRHHCAFCITTVARGESRSIPLEIVLNDIRAAVRGGAQETVLTGVQLGSWGKDLDPALELHDLVLAILKDTEVPRLRLSSIEPWDITPSLIDLIKEERVARHLHLPLQSGSADVLRRMTRANTPGQYEELVNQIRGAIPDIALTTDIMTGFPAETDDEFRESLDFIYRMNFADGHVFTYSAREGTPAVNFPHQVAHPVRKERNARIRELLKESAVKYRQQFVGAELIALWEQVETLEDNNHKATGLTDNYLRVEASAYPDVWNSFSAVRITGINPRGVWGEIVNQAKKH